MRVANHARYEARIEYEPEHYNRTCGCTIPAAWTAFVYDNDNGEYLPKRPCGDTREEAIDNVRRELGGV